jgi:hypothetical protein
MERMPEYRPVTRSEREPSPEITRLRSPEGIREYLRTPENAAEIMQYFDYLRELSGFVRSLPAAQREVGMRVLDVAVNRTAYAFPTDDDIALHLPPPPTTLPPPGTTLHLGEHMDVTLGQTAAACWPDRDAPELTLSDGVVVTPNTPAGIIDYYRNMRRLTKDESLLKFTRELIDSAAESLTLLAERAKKLGDHPYKPDAFSGMSHLARLAHRFGFTAFDIADPGLRQEATDTSFEIARGIAGNNSEWNRFREKYKPAKVAVISTPELIRRYSKS